MIYADENVWLPVANGLQRRGWEVTTALEADMLGVGDFEHLQYATERDWPLLTFDDDFLSIAESGSTVENHASIVYIAQYGKSVGEMVRYVDATLQRRAERDLANAVVYA